METILYEYHLNLGDYLGNLIPLLVGFAFLIYAILLFKGKERGFVVQFFKIVGLIAGRFAS